MSLKRYENRTAVVTGAASGIGKAVALRLASEGARVVCCDRNAEGAGETVAEIAGRGGRAWAEIFDVTDPDAVHGAFDRVRAGGVDMLSNNAGIGGLKSMFDVTRRDMDVIFEVNFFGAFTVMRECLQIMRESGRPGRVVNMSSVSGIAGLPGRGAYGASKGALIAMTRTAAVEMAPYGITVNVVAPGPVDTPLTQRSHGERTRAAWAAFQLVKRYATVDEIAAAVAYLGSDEAASLTGQVLAIDCGLTAGARLDDRDW